MGVPSPSPRTTTLSTGLVYPLAGLGLYRVTPEQTRSVIPAALDVGCDLLDTAVSYRYSHEAVRSTLAGVPTKPAWVQTKIPPAMQGYDGARACALRCISELDGCAANLSLLIHWPGRSQRPPDSPDHSSARRGSWLALQELFVEGKVQAIGVSNFEVHHLKDLMGAPGVTITPQINQVEMHPLLAQGELRAFCASAGIHVQAYGALGQGSPRLLESRAVVDAAASRGASPAQIVLRWALDKGCGVLSRTCNPARAQSNMAALDLDQLEPAVTDTLDALDDGTHFCWNPQTIR